MPLPTIPDDVAQYVKSTLPGLRFIAKEDYRGDQYVAFGERIRWAVTGDFDGNGVEDFAALTVNPAGAVSLTAFHRFKSGIRHYVLNDNLGGIPTGSTLLLQKAGLTWVSLADAEQKEYKRLKNPGIAEDWLQTCYTMLYYWENGGYHSVYRGV